MTHSNIEKQEREIEIIEENDRKTKMEQEMNNFAIHSATFGQNLVSGLTEMSQSLASNVVQAALSATPI